jgi:hypothetical protein
MKKVEPTPKRSTFFFKVTVFVHPMLPISEKSLFLEGSQDSSIRSGTSTL